MGYYVYTLVSFSPPEEGMAELAREWLTISEADDDIMPCAARMFRYMADGLGVHCGPKGEVFAWGEIGNGRFDETFVEKLLPFWKALGELPYGPRVVNVFLEGEADKEATQYQIWTRTGSVFPRKVMGWDQG